MNFKRDILLIDTEFSGFDLQKHEILQIAGVLLDKKTLKEKKVFSSFVRPTRWAGRDLSSMAVNKITLNMVKDAPALKDVLRLFDKTFGHNVIQSFYVGYNDKRFLMEAYRRSKIKWQFDYHYFELWGLFYSYLALKNKLTSSKHFGGFGLESLIKMFKIKINKNQLHDALVDCRVEAEVLRKVILNLGK
ncbi:MAG TPA: 3'-5' exonuclease [Candidatus Limnocylindria bacterium]|nr:3'-5' exonuclease [Candidatus Limnocylindria bacterium]